ncbi:purine-cytosine permease family protein [Gluconacetobacter tumulisoli]|uniref:Cytosine permease n=1 Tax=Gluconacetobacter tumulisoli TaxID=1286189 RepID=A0A7W4PL45_9PROT|nr:cytosine permease [Gluconacetobacter tumulisoli]MBB2202117.1 cytosine permease [Gluconacetobacter tumulisoli]
MIEENSIGFVPLDRRHGQVRDLFTLWFTTNIAPLGVMTGAMAVQVYGLSVPWAVSAIIPGHLVGALVLGACSAQGPQMGLAQMIQGRGQFGRYGALLVVTFAMLLYLGFFTSNIVLASRSIHTMAPAVGLSPGAAGAALAAAGIGILGYRVIHVLNRIGIWFMGAALIVAALMIIHRMPAVVWWRNDVTLVGWLSMFSLAAVWHISFCCYTSDYSRYLPPDVGIRGPLLASFLGAAAGAAASFIFGVLVVADVPAGMDPMEAAGTETGVVGTVLMVLFILNIISHNALNIYGAVLSIITMIQTVLARWRPGRTARVVLSVLVLGGCLAVAMLSADSFVPRFIRVVISLLMVLSPWAAINIFDFYVLKRGKYDIASFFRADGGIYGLINLPASGAYVAGIIVQIPFLSGSFYTGPIARRLGGMDIGWLVAPVVTIGVHVLLRAAARTPIEITEAGSRTSGSRISRG